MGLPREDLRVSTNRRVECAITMVLPDLDVKTLSA
jgi:hypothetical protein